MYLIPLYRNHFFLPRFQKAKYYNLRHSSNLDITTIVYIQTENNYEEIPKKQLIVKLHPARNNF